VPEPREADYLSALPKCIRWYWFANLDEVLVGYTLNHNPDYDPGIPGYACQAMRAILQRSGVIRIGPG